MLQWCVCEGSSRVAFRALSSQVIWCVGRVLERYCLVLSETEANEAGEGAAMKEAMPVPKRVAHYVHACEEIVARSEGRFISGCADKSRVASYDMLSGVYCLSDNTCFGGVPQEWGVLWPTSFARASGPVAPEISFSVKLIYTLGVPKAKIGVSFDTFVMFLG